MELPAPYDVDLLHWNDCLTSHFSTWKSVMSAPWNYIRSHMTLNDCAKPTTLHYRTKVPDNVLWITSPTHIKLKYRCNTTMPQAWRLKGMPRNLVAPCYRMACMMTSATELFTVIPHHYLSWIRVLRWLNVNPINKTCRKLALQDAATCLDAPNCRLPPRHGTSGQPLLFWNVRRWIR